MASKELYGWMVALILFSIAKASANKEGHCEFYKNGTDTIAKVIINRSHFDKDYVKSFSIFKGTSSHQDRMVFYEKPRLVPKCAYDYENASWCNTGILPNTTTTEKTIELNINVTASPFAESLPLNIKFDADGQGNFDHTIPLICVIPLNHTSVEENVKRNITPKPSPATTSGHQQSLSTSRNGFTELPSLKSKSTISDGKIQPSDAKTTGGGHIEKTGKQARLKRILIPIGVVLPLVTGVSVIIIIYKVCKKWKLSSNQLPEKPYKLSDVQQSTESELDNSQVDLEQSREIQ